MDFAPLDNSHLNLTQKVNPVQGQIPEISYTEGVLIQGLAPASAAVFGLSNVYLAGIAVAKFILK